MYPGSIKRSNYSPGISNKRKSILKYVKANRTFVLFVAPAVIVYFVTCYLPIWGIFMAFEDYSPVKGIFGSKWIGLENFTSFFVSGLAFKLIKNSLLISVYSLLWGFPLPILLAILLNEVKGKFFKGLVQTMSYLPYFISSVVLIGIASSLLSLNNGIINIILNDVFGSEKIYFLIKPEYFRTIYVVIGIWQSTGWGAVIYLASISSFDTEIYEVALIDGANRFQRIIHITIPLLKPTIVIMLILSCASLMNVGFEKVWLLQTPMTTEVSDVIETYVYKRGFGFLTGVPDYSFSTAVGLFQSVVNCILLIATNTFSKKVFHKSIY